MAAITIADCPLVNDQLVAETGRIATPIYKKVIKQSPWVALVQRGMWPDGMGVTLSNMMFERTLPAQDDGSDWADLAVSDGVTVDACLATPEELKLGQTLRTMKLQRTIKHSPHFCLEDLRFDWELAQQLNAFKDNLTSTTRWVWESRDKNEYYRLSDFKITEGGAAGFDAFATTHSASSPPTSRLLQGTLDTIYMILSSRGAGEDALGMDNGAPVFGLITDMWTSLDLIRQDNNVRLDFHYYDPDTLLAPLGAPRSYHGYKHIIDLFPPRYNIVSNAFVRVKPFKDAAAATKGFKRDLDPAYIYAQYQDSFVFVKSVFRQLVPTAISSPGGGLTFTPNNYMGEFKWKNIPHEVCNPDETIGFFRAIYMSASEPGHTEYGFAVRHLSCPPLRIPQTSCYS